MDARHGAFEAGRSQIGRRTFGLLARDTYALVLAGGRGSRLRELTDWRCKPAVPFGGKYRIIDFTLSNCVNSGVRRIGVATQYKSYSLLRHLQRGWSFLDGRIGEHVDILPAQQQVAESWYSGTADAVFQNLNVLRRDGCRYILVLWAIKSTRWNTADCWRSMWRAMRTPPWCACGRAARRRAPPSA